MKMIAVAQPNQKGQLVIPKKFRDHLGIDQNTYLKLTLSEHILSIVPIRSLETLSTTMSKDQTSYLKILQKTKGAWGQPTKSEKTRERKIRAAELKAARRNQTAW